ncbi:unnamed protein product, partial [Scytosiphon promiscuus]
AAAASGTPAGSGSPILTALKANASEKILPVPMVVTSGTPEMNNKCRECQELIQARLDEPTLLRDNRHYWDFDDGDEDDDDDDDDEDDDLEDLEDLDKREGEDGGDGGGMAFGEAPSCSPGRRVDGD